jgi:uncharacterized membrane-anchored protein YitT (DUF2179 family)
MLGIPDLLSFNIGFFVGVFGSYLIYLTYSIIANYAAKKKLDLFFERFGALKGIAFYEHLAEESGDIEYKNKMNQLVEDYTTMARENEEKMDALMAEYAKTTPVGDE